MYGILNDSGSLIARFTVPLAVKNNEPILISDALSLKRFSSKSVAQRWEIEAGVEPLIQTSQDLMINLITKGYTEGVKVRIPQNIIAVKKLVDLSGQPLTSGIITSAASAGTTQISVSGFTGTIPAGLFIKFSNYNKLYMVRTDCIRTSTTGTVTLNIYPALRFPVINTTQVIYNEVDVDFYYDTDVVRGMVYEDGILMDPGVIKLVEKL